MKNIVNRALVAKKNKFLSKSVPRGTRTIWRYLGALFLLFTFAIGNVMADENAPKSTKESKSSVNAIEQQVLVKEDAKNDVIEENAEEDREMENIGVKLSGDYTLRLIEENKETNWTIIIAVISIIANVLVVILTYVLQTRLKHFETAEIRTQKIQEIELKQQALMYENLKDIDNYLIEKDDVLWEEGAESGVLVEELETKITKAEEFHKNNTMYIRGRLGQLTANLLAEYKAEKDGNRNAESMNKTQEMLSEYVDVYHNHPEKIKEIL